MTDKHRKRPRDPAQLAKLMIDIATGEEAKLEKKNGRPVQKAVKKSSQPSASAKKA